ncbi:MAG: hypothetical protein MJ081_01640 [Ruminococcus sp.]|nr:hypothetical protein [Ruminococcus sp.]
MNEYKKELELYEQLNEIAVKGEVVVFGSAFAKNIPVSELAQTYGIDRCVYNRSFGDMSAADALNLAEKAVLPLQPKKIILQLGETDLERGYKSVTEIIKDYNELIRKFRENNKRVKIVILSVCSEENETDKLNTALENIAHKTKCQFVDVSGSVHAENPYLKVFSEIRLFIPDKINFCDAMSFAGAY